MMKIIVDDLTDERTLQLITTHLTADNHLRKGVARAILQHIVNEATKWGYTTLSLETGSMKAFAPAQKLYESFGFTYCGPFADYKEDPNSVFMTLKL